MRIPVENLLQTRGQEAGEQFPIDVGGGFWKERKYPQGCVCRRDSPVPWVGMDYPNPSVGAHDDDHEHAEGTNIPLPQDVSAHHHHHEVSVLPWTLDQY